VSLGPLEKFEPTGKFKGYRFDGDGGVFGDEGVYLEDPSKRYFNSKDMLGFSATEIANVKARFEKAFVLTPETVKLFNKLTKKALGPEAVKNLKNSGYDGLIVSGFKDTKKYKLASESFKQPQIVHFKPETLEVVKTSEKSGKTSNKGYAEGGLVDDYTIQQGDTLTKIAKENETTVEDLARLNKIENVDKIYANDVIKLSSSPAPVETPVDIFNEVSKMSTPSAVAILKQFKTTPTNEQLKAIKKVADKIDAKKLVGVAQELMDEYKEAIISKTLAAQKTVFSTVDTAQEKIKDVVSSIKIPELNFESKGRTAENTQGVETSNFLPENIMAYAKYVVGNKLGLDAEGSDIDVAKFGTSQKEVLKQAMQNADKAGRDYIKYSDYPEMKSGERPEQFYKAKRSERSMMDLVKESFTDPVFEMFTTTGVFNFKKLSNGSFEILPDTYDFDKSKSGGKDRKEAMDSYGSLTQNAQDMSEKQTYHFNVKGKI
jgi:LysM repeat protein